MSGSVPAGDGSEHPSPALRIDRADAETAVTVAVRAPSIHNTQPWRWELDAGGLLLFADRDRQLAVADPDGHSLLISCGAALHLTELALRAEGFAVDVERLPEPGDPDLLARFSVRGGVSPDDALAARVDAALRRRSDRRPFALRELDEDVIEELQRASGGPGARVDFPRLPDQRINLAVAVSWADRVERDDSAYTAEMARWLRDPEVHATADGIPLEAVPHVPPQHPRRVDLPQRDFEVGVTGRQLIDRDVDERPLIAVVLTDFDNPRDHLLSGEAMMRLMIEAELRGLASCPLSQAVDFAAFRTRVQGLMGWVGYPQIMLRLGYPSSPPAQLPATPRRGPDSVLTVRGSGS
ncbi:MAG TPA: hypothetical protein VFH38_11590 [Jatrophihabitans sp.]|nr:hypothetical protein [Jatrophihabitans sp.]